MPMNVNIQGKIVDGPRVEPVSQGYSSVVEKVVLTIEVIDQGIKRSIEVRFFDHNEQVFNLSKTPRKGDIITVNGILYDYQGNNPVLNGNQLKILKTENKEPNGAENIQAKNKKNSHKGHDVFLNQLTPNLQFYYCRDCRCEVEDA